MVPVGKASRVNVIIRADASVTIGTGHVMRCLTLAEALNRSGIKSTFACRILSGNLNSYIAHQGYPVYPIPLDENGSWEEDARYMRMAMADSGENADWIVVDHYGLDIRWESELRHAARHIMAIDDLANRRHDCDLLLDQNLCGGQGAIYAKLIPPGATQLIGPKYALLRREFAQARAMIKPRDGSLKRILVFFGGSDPGNETGKALAALATPDFAEIALDVVVGESNPHRERVRNLCAARPNIFFHCQVSNIAELMAKADLSIGAGGTATWERLALGLPALITAVADNQVKNMCLIDEQGAAVGLGMAQELSVEAISRAVDELRSTPEILSAMSNKALGLVDAAGAERVVNFFIRGT